MSTLLVVVVLVALAVRTPLFVVIGAAAIACFALFVPGYQDFASHQVMAVKITSIINKNVLLAIPFFTISGAIMTAGGIARRLVRVAEVMVGHVRGGLAISSVLACMVFASISGSSPVTLIAVGSLMFPAMVKAGYRENFALGLITTAGSLGCLIPPSIPMLLYAISVSGKAMVDVRELFIAGAGPALLIAGMLGAYSWVEGGRTVQTAAQRKATWAERSVALREGLWALMLPVLILGGIYFGVFTATEASAVSVVYALAVELLIHRELKLKALAPAILRAVVLMGALILIIVLSFGLNDFMVEKQVAEHLLEWIQEQKLSPWGFMLAINIFLVVTGCLMDSLSAIVLFTPLICPTAVALGIDPLHLGVVFIVNMEIGYVAPPIATNLFVSAQLFKKPFSQVVRAVLPSLGILCVGLVVVSYVPSISIGPVYALRGESFWRPFGSFGSMPSQAPPAPTAAPGVDAGTPAPRIISLEEMMARARADEAARADAGAPATP